MPGTTPPASPVALRGALLFVTGYPIVKRPFNTHPDSARPDFSNSFDLLFGGLELITGSQHLHRYDDDVATLAARGQAGADYDGYLQAFSSACRTAAFAIGLERWVARLSGDANIRRDDPVSARPQATRTMSLLSVADMWPTRHSRGPRVDDTTDSR